MRTNLDWLDRAACRGMDVNLFYPTSTGQGARIEAAAAVEICHRCPVRGECTLWSKRASNGMGVWGGRLKSAQSTGRPPAEIDHGSEAGAKQHIRRGEKPCGSCRRGASLANAIRVEKRRA